MELTEGEKRANLHEEEYHHAHQIEHDEEGYRHAYRRESLAKAPAKLRKESIAMGYGLLGNRSSVDDDIIRERSPAELKALGFLAQQARTGLGADPRISKKESERLLRRDPKLRKMMRNHRVAPGTQGAKTEFASHRMTAEDCDRELRNRFRAQFKGVTRAFRALDKDKNGHIDKHEFRYILNKYHIRISDHELNRLMQMYDGDGNGEIEMNEFMKDFGKVLCGDKGSVEIKEDIQHIFGVQRCVDRADKQEELALLSVKDADHQLHLKCMMRSRETQRLFRLFDEDSSGFIDKREFKRVLNFFSLHLSPENFERLWNLYDVDGDGEIVYKELIDKLTRAPAHVKGVLTGYRGVSSRSIKRGKTTNMRTWRSDQLRIRGNTAKEAQRLFEDKLENQKESVCLAFRSIDVARSSTGLSTGSIPMNGPESFRHLLEKYNIDMNDAEWKKFSMFYDPQSTGILQYKKLFVLNRRDHYTYKPEPVSWHPISSTLPSVSQPLIATSPIKKPTRAMNRAIAVPRIDLGAGIPDVAPTASGRSAWAMK